MAEKKRKKRIRSISSAPVSFRRDLIELLADGHKGNKRQRTKITALKKQLGDEIYTHAVYLLTHSIPESAEKAKKTFLDIVEHRNFLSRKLSRPVSLTVSALDYIEISSIGGAAPDLSNFTIVGRVSDTIGSTQRIYESRNFITELQKVLNREENLPYPVSIILLDIDHLSEMHSAYGYPVEEKAVEDIRKELENNVQEVDRIYQYTGNTFAVILPGLGKKDVSKVTDRLKNAVSGMEIGNSAVSPVVRTGSATVSPNAGRPPDPQTLVDNADRSIFESWFDQRTPSPVQPEKEITVPGQKRIVSRRVIPAIPIVPGRALGKSFSYKDVLTRDFKTIKLRKFEIPEELKRINKAFTRVKKDLAALQRQISGAVSHNEEAILQAQLTILDDPFIRYEIEDLIQEKMINAEQIIRETFGKVKSQFEQNSNPMIKEKISDIQDIEWRLLRVLTGIEDNILSAIPSRAVIMTPRLLPSDTIHLNTHNAVAFVTEEGSGSSHSAILARALNLPYVSNVNSRIFNSVPQGTVVIVDGNEGRIIINPDVEEKQQVMSDQTKKKRKFRSIKKKMMTRSFFIGDEPIRILSNVSTAEDAALAAESNAEGVGLFRLENLYMASSILPNKESLVNEINTIVTPLHHLPITIRLLDIGGDKNLPYLKTESGRNPLLGLRGVRVLKKYPGLLRTQLRAFIKLAEKYTLKILVPMTSLAEDVVFIRSFLEKECKKLNVYPPIQIGSMIETPSAIMDIDNIIKNSDFLSIGTNDLIQYAVAADRETLSCSEYYEAGAQLVAKSLKTVVQKSKDAGIECIICGEMAANPEYTKELIDSGFRFFSVAPARISTLRKTLADIL
ncbi:MAG: phosphoenolpyruvate--protein phosphotransferase [Chitinivibrionales bacterium]|nr:phosphoenolpyruvate--protein phosphotransferase [Chitinivibrionales bacterium]